MQTPISVAVSAVQNDSEVPASTRVWPSATPHATLDVPSNANANAAPTPTHLEHLVPWYRYCRCLRMPRRARSSKLLSATPSYPTTRIVPKVTTRSQSRRCAEEPGSMSLCTATPQPYALRVDSGRCTPQQATAPAIFLHQQRPAHASPPPLRGRMR